MSRVQGHQPHIKDTRRISKMTVKPEINFRYSDVFSLGAFLREALSPTAFVRKEIIGQQPNVKDPGSSPGSFL